MSLKSSGFVISSNEVVIALVQPTGTNLSNFRDKIKAGASRLNADIEFINLTDFLDLLDANSSGLKNIITELKQLTQNESIRSLGFQKLSKKMHFGTLLRKHIRKDIFSIFGLSKIQISRDKWFTDIRERGEELGQKKKIYILDSLKNPSEIETLREVYTNSFWLVGISAERNHRAEFLKSSRGVEPIEAYELIFRDEDEDEDYDYGQKLNDTFECSDFFFNENCTHNEVNRLLEIIFSNCNIAPTRDEQYMHMANSIAAQSSDLSRQVGAVLVSKQGELLSIGCNDVPKFSGGQYKEGDDPDYRDVTLGNDPNHKRRNQILDSFSPTTIKDPKIISMIKNLTEYHRAVHAEMEAIISCARKGISTVDAVLYATTYPCHNCAKHLLNAGVKEVIYIQAYSKSLALDLHDDAISEAQGSESKMNLKRYKGIGPRRYFDYFSLTLSSNGLSRKGENVSEPWKASVYMSQQSKIKFPLHLLAVSEAEKLAMKYLYNLSILDNQNSITTQISILKAA